MMSSGRANAPMKILLVDDNPVNITVLEGFVRRLGYQAIGAGSGAEALRLFEEDRPDVVLLDLMMPGLNGGEVAQRMRVLAGRHWIPILIVSASTEEKDRSFSLTQGADGYLVKPVSFQALASQLAAMHRITTLQQQTEIQLDQLQRYRDYIEEEQRLARYILRHLRPPPELEGLSARIQPARGFSGDYIAASARPGGRIYLILADATGHGLSAAVCLIPVFTIFEGMVRKDLPIARIAREMNREMKQRTPTGHFVAVTLALIDETLGLAEIWNGGNPPALLRCDQGRETEVHSAHPPVGLLPDDRFDPTTRRVDWGGRCELLLVSDGMVEANSPDGEQFGMDRVRDAFRTGEAPWCDDLLRRVTAHAASRPVDDDMSVLSFIARRRPAAAEAAAMPEPVVPEPVEPDPGDAGAPADDSAACELRLHLHADQVRRVDVPEVVDHWGRMLGWSASLQSRVPPVLNELWVNAVDHGLLRLDSGLKSAPDGMERYFLLRAERLAALQYGWITVVVRMEPRDGSVRLSVEDSGPGFDFRAWMSTPEPAPPNRYAGRGLRTARALAQELVFDKDGRRAQARLAPQHAAARQTKNTEQQRADREKG